MSELPTVEELVAAEGMARTKGVRKNLMPARDAYVEWCAAREEERLRPTDPTTQAEFAERWGVTVRSLQVWQKHESFIEDLAAAKKRKGAGVPLRNKVRIDRPEDPAAKFEAVINFLFELAMEPAHPQHKWAVSELMKHGGKQAIERFQAEATFDYGSFDVPSMFRVACEDAFALAPVEAAAIAREFLGVRGDVPVQH